MGTYYESDWGISTRWNHLDCIYFPGSIDSASSIQGFENLDQESRKLVSEKIKKKNTADNKSQKYKLEPKSVAVASGDHMRSAPLAVSQINERPAVRDSTIIASTDAEDLSADTENMLQLFRY